MTDDDPLTRIDNAAALSTNEATENSGTGPGSSRARPKTNRFDLRNYSTMCSREVSQYLRSHKRTLPRGATELLQPCTEIAVTARIRFTVIRSTLEGNHNRLDVG